MLLSTCRGGFLDFKRYLKHLSIGGSEIGGSQAILVNLAIQFLFLSRRRL